MVNISIWSFSTTKLLISMSLSSRIYEAKCRAGKNNINNYLLQPIDILLVFDVAELLFTYNKYLKTIYHFI